MEKNIVVGIFVGLTFASTISIIESTYFTKNQKIFLGILVVFPPAQWILALVIGIWNKQTESTIGFKIDNANKNNIELEKLKKLGVLSEKEYLEKKDKVLNLKINELFLKSEEYLSLKKLKKNNILTQAEFEEKSKLLKNKILEDVDFEENKENILEPELNSDEPKSAKIISFVLIAIFVAMIVFGILNKVD